MTLIALTTALATPPATAKPRPSAEATSKSELPSPSSLVYSSMPRAFIMPAISSKVRTKSTSERTDLRMASSFLAEQGPTKTILALGCCWRSRRAVSVMGVRAIEMHSACSGNSVLAMTDQAGQQDVPMNGIFSGTSSMKSSASWTVQRSAPTATSSMPEKPSIVKAWRSLSTLPLPPNWPTKAGATSAMTSSPRLMA